LYTNGPPTKCRGYNGAKTPLHQITMLSHRTDMDLSQSERHINVGSGFIMQEKIHKYK